MGQDRKEDKDLEKAKKAENIAELRAKFEKANAAFIAEYKGIKAVVMNDLRKSLRANSIEFKVVRNTLARRAVAGLGAEVVTKDLKGSTAIVFSYNDAAQAAKAITQFAKEQPGLKLRGGVLGAKAITADDIVGLSQLPSREVLLAKLLGTLNAPVSGFVCVLSGVPRKLLYALNAVGSAKEAQAS